MQGDPYTIAGRFTLWYAFLGGPAAWSLHLLTTYGPVEVACMSVGPELLVGITAATTLLSLGAGVAGWRVWSRAKAVAKAQAGDAPQEDDGVQVRRTRFMGFCGMIMGGFFALSILVEGMPILIGDPCLSLP